MSRDAESDLPPELRAALEQDAEDGTASGLEEMWALLDRGAPPDEALPDVADTWTGVRRHLEEEPREGEARAEDRPSKRPAAHQSSPSRLWRWGGVVAAALVLVIAGWWWSQPVEVTVVSGSTVARTLPDGSTVELHGDTRLTYPRTFVSAWFVEAERRVVRLQGEAYFEVESGERPFIVQTPAVRVEVVGTAFSVRSRPGEADDAHVALAEGRLHVTDRGGDRTELALQSGQAATLGPEGTMTAVRDTSIERIMAWRRGGFAATARPLPALVRALERRFGRPIRLDASIGSNARSAPLTLYYSRGADLETILNDVCMARGLTYRATARGYLLAQGDDDDNPQSP